MKSSDIQDAHDPRPLVEPSASDDSNCLIHFSLKGLHGSKAFVNEYLIPIELLQNGVKYLGAYIIDMVLMYDTKPSTQELNYDMTKVSL